MLQLGVPGLRGEEASNALAFGDGLAGEMTPEQVAQAEAMATRCRESNFKTYDRSFSLQLTVAAGTER